MSDKTTILIPTEIPSDTPIESTETSSVPKGDLPLTDTPVESTENPSEILNSILDKLSKTIPDLDNKLKQRLESTVSSIRDFQTKKKVVTKLEYPEIKDAVYSLLDSDTSITSYRKLFDTLKKQNKPCGSSIQIKTAWQEYKVDKLKNRPKVPPKFVEAISETTKENNEELSRRINTQTENALKKSFADFKKELIGMLKSVDPESNPLVEKKAKIPSRHSLECERPDPRNFATQPNTLFNRLVPVRRRK